MMNYKTSTAASATSAANTFVIQVNGYTELKQYIQATTQFVQDIRTELDADLWQPKAIVPFTSEHEMTALKHACFVRDKVRHQTSAFAVAESAIHEALAQLEIIRKMLVNNKQTKRTTVRGIQKIIAEMHACISTLEGTIETNASPIQQLRQMKENTKQHHRTVSRSLLQHANRILIAMRTKHILAYKLAAQDAVGEIIHHAEKCRAFIAKRDTEH